MLSDAQMKAEHRVYAVKKASQEKRGQCASYCQKHLSNDPGFDAAWHHTIEECSDHLCKTTESVATHDQAYGPHQQQQ